MFEVKLLKIRCDIYIFYYLYLYITAVFFVFIYFICYRRKHNFNKTFTYNFKQFYQRMRVSHFNKRNIFHFDKSFFDKVTNIIMTKVTHNILLIKHKVQYALVASKFPPISHLRISYLYVTSEYINTCIVGLSIYKLIAVICFFFEETKFYVETRTKGRISVLKTISIFISSI